MNKREKLEKVINEQLIEIELIPKRDKVASVGRLIDYYNRNYKSYSGWYNDRYRKVLRYCRMRDVCSNEEI